MDANTIMTTVSICIDVPDTKIASAFYTNVLGCRVESESENNTKLSLYNTTIYLMEKKENTNALIVGEDSRRYTRHWTPVHLDFHVTDMETPVSLLNKYGGQLEGKESGDWGEAAFCSDPFGNGFCLLRLQA